MARFPHLAKQIFNRLNDSGLVKSREVARAWLDFIDEEKNRVYPWLRIVGIPAILLEGNTYLHLAAGYGQIGIFKDMLSNEDIKNSKNDLNQTPVHLACQNGRFNIVKFCAGLKMEFDGKDKTTGKSLQRVSSISRIRVYLQDCNHKYSLV